MKKLTREWLQKAEEDLAAAKRLASGKPPLINTACFHCQQAVEKFLKAFLQEFDLEIPKIHELDELLDLLLPKDATLEQIRPGLDDLTPFAVEYRYPGKKASARETRSSLKLAENVRHEIRARLGLRDRRRIR